MIKFSVGGISGGHLHLVQHPTPRPTPAQIKASWIKLLRAVSIRGWIMSRDIDSTTSPGNLLKYLPTLCRNIFLHGDCRKGD